MKVDYAQVLKACKNHDRDAQRVLYEEFSPLLLGIGIRYLGSRDEAQDLLHDAFIKIFTQIDRVKQPEKLRAWMCRVMVSTVVDYLRGKRQLVYWDDAQLEERQDVVETADENFDSDAYALPDILRAIQELPDAYRTVFNMRVVEEMEFADIAKALGIAEVTVRSNLTRARNILRKQLTSNPSAS